MYWFQFRCRRVPETLDIDRDLAGVIGCGSGYSLVPIGLVMAASTIIVFIYIRRKHWM